MQVIHLLLIYTLLFPNREVDFMVIAIAVCQGLSVLRFLSWICIWRIRRGATFFVVVTVVVLLWHIFSLFFWLVYIFNGRGHLFLLSLLFPPVVLFLLNAFVACEGSFWVCAPEEKPTDPPAKPRLLQDKVAYSEIDINLRSETCIICLDEYKPDSLVTELCCHHVFHSNCIESWLSRQGALCPFRCPVGATHTSQSPSNSVDSRNRAPAVSEHDHDEVVFLNSIHVGLNGGGATRGAQDDWEGDVDGSEPWSERRPANREARHIVLESNEAESHDLERGLHVDGHGRLYSQLDVRWSGDVSTGGAFAVVCPTWISSDSTESLTQLPSCGSHVDLDDLEYLDLSPTTFGNSERHRL